MGSDNHWKGASSWLDLQIWQICTEPFILNHGPVLHYFTNSLSHPCFHLQGISFGVPFLQVGAIGNLIESVHPKSAKLRVALEASSIFRLIILQRFSASNFFYCFHFKFGCSIEKIQQSRKLMLLRLQSTTLSIILFILKSTSASFLLYWNIILSSFILFHSLLSFSNNLCT